MYKFGLPVTYRTRELSTNFRGLRRCCLRLTTNYLSSLILLLMWVIEINRLCFINPLKSSSILSTFSIPSAIVSFKRYDCKVVRFCFKPVLPFHKSRRNFKTTQFSSPLSPRPIVSFLPSIDNLTSFPLLALAKASSGIFNNHGEPPSKVYLDVSFDNVGLEGTEKFILQSSGEILDKDSFIVFNHCALKPRKKLTPLPLTNFWTVNQNSRVSLLYLTALMESFE